MLTKNRFPIREYNKLAARKIGLLEIIEKINLNAYWLKLPSHIKMSDVFNVKHLVLDTDDSFDDDMNSTTNSLKPEEDDVDRVANKFMKNYGEEFLIRSKVKS